MIVFPKRLSKALYRVEQTLVGRGQVFEMLEFLQRSQYWPPEQLSELQWHKLQQLLAHAYATVPYYRARLKEAGVSPEEIRSYADFLRIPILTRSDLRNHTKDLISNQFDQTSLTRASSSGSTGQPVTLFQTRDFHIWARAHQLRNYHWCGGYDIGDRFALLWGSELYFRFKSILDKVETRLQNRLELNTFRLSRDSMVAYAERLAQFRPILISSYPSSLLFIGRLMGELGIQGIRPAAIQTTSEVLTDGDRSFLAQTFGASIFDKYGARETNVIAHECALGEGMHMNVENVFVEFVRGNRPVAPGEHGDIVVTNLNNFGMPLIRYAIGDVGGPLDGQCACGITLPRMSRMKGRQSDLIVTSAGDIIDPYFFSYLLQSSPDIEYFQVVQETPHDLTLKIVGKHLVDRGSFEAHVRSKVHQFTDPSFRISFQYLDDLPVEPSGKRRLVISKVPGPWHNRGTPAS